VTRIDPELHAAFETMATVAAKVDAAMAELAAAAGSFREMTRAIDQLDLDRSSRINELHAAIWAAGIGQTGQGRPQYPEDLRGWQQEANRQQFQCDTRGSLRRRS
jgi:hypothetical protein